MFFLDVEDNFFVCSVYFGMFRVPTDQGIQGKF